VRGVADGTLQLEFDPAWHTPAPYADLARALMSANPASRPSLRSVIDALAAIVPPAEFSAAGAGGELLESRQSMTVAERIVGRDTFAAMRAALAQGTAPVPVHLPDAFILFSDVVGFSKLSTTIDAGIVYDGLSRLFARFDAIAEELGVLQLETLGDAWLAAGGVCLGEDRERDRVELAAAMAELGMRMCRAAEETPIDPARPAEFGSFAIRVGIARGPVVGSVLGTRTLSKFTFLGNTMNTASRMESTAPHGTVQIEPRAFADAHAADTRGWAARAAIRRRVVEAKGIGQVRTYVLDPPVKNPRPGPTPAQLPGAI
jgi:class 3 adenylate cyclase